MVGDYSQPSHRNVGGYGNCYFYTCYNTGVMKKDDVLILYNITRPDIETRLYLGGMKSTYIGVPPVNNNRLLAHVWDRSQSGTYLFYYKENSFQQVKPVARFTITKIK